MQGATQTIIENSNLSAVSFINRNKGEIYLQKSDGDSTIKKSLCLKIIKWIIYTDKKYS